MSLPRVAIIYLTYNTADSYRDITRCFESLTKMDYPMDRVEIICVENKSAHGESIPFIESEWIARVGVDFPQFSCHRNEGDVGFAGAENVGFKIAVEHEADYVFLLNQDADVDPSFLTNAVKRAETDPTIMYVQSLLLLGQDKERVNSIGNQYHFLGYGYAGGYGWTKARALAELEAQKEHNPDLNVPYFTGAAVLARVSMAQRIGLFDGPFYMYHEDVDASFNARMHGYKSVVEPSSIVYHYYEFSKSIKKFYWMERNRWIVLFTYYKLPTLALLFIPFVCVEVASFLLAIKSGWWKEKLRSWTYFLKPSAWKWIRTRRAFIQSSRTISDREFLSYATDKILFQESGLEGTGAEGIKKDAGGFIVSRLANPILHIMWQLIYACIRW